MTEVTPKTSSDAKKTYADPDVVDLLSVDETEGKTITAAEDDPLAGPS
jgi:hypothetical protein